MPFDVFRGSEESRDGPGVGLVSGRWFDHPEYSFQWVRQVTTPIEPYDRVRFISDQYRSSGAPIDTIGYVLEVYPDGGLEVEVSEPASGVTQALISVRLGDV